MKSILFFLSLLLISNPVFSQNSIAKLKFEQAEEAYVQSRYQESLDYISEVETLLKGANTTTLYLKIVALEKKITTLETATYNDVISLRKYCDTYLKTTEGNVELEDKFKEVYFVTERIKGYPTNQIDFEAYRKKKVETKIKENLEQKKYTIGEISLGMKLVEIPENTWTRMERVGFDYEVESKLYTGFSKKMDMTALFAVTTSSPSQSVLGLNFLSIERNAQTVFSISQILESGDKMNRERILQIYLKKIEELNKVYGETNVVQNESDQKIGKSKVSEKNATVRIDNKVLYTVQYIVNIVGLNTYIMMQESISYL